MSYGPWFKLVAYQLHLKMFYSNKDIIIIIIIVHVLWLPALNSYNPN